MTKDFDWNLTLRYHRKSARQNNHNYGWSSTYFITIRASTKEPIFEIPALRTILQETWEALPARFEGLQLDEFVIMPDHVHLIVHLEGNVAHPTTLGRVIGAYKSLTTVAWLHHLKTTNEERAGIIWQRNYHDEAIRDAQQLEQTRQYIRNNPEKLRDKLKDMS